MVPNVEATPLRGSTDRRGTSVAVRARGRTLVVTGKRFAPHASRMKGPEERNGQWGQSGRDDHIRPP